MYFSFIQILYIIIVVTCIVLNGRQRILARPLALLSVGLSLYIYYSAGLYAKSLIKCILIVMNLYGWYHWQYGGKNKTTLTVSTLPPGYLAVLIISGALSAWGLGKVLTIYPDADLPYWDSLNAVMLLIAQWLLMRKKLETWLVFIPTDILYTILLYYKGLYLLTGLHLFYIVLAINGYRAWLQSYRQEQIFRSTSVNS